MQQEHTASRWHKNRARSIHQAHAESIKRYHRRLPWALPLMLVLIAAQFFIAGLCATLNLGYVLLLSATVGAFIAWGLHHYLHEISHHLLPGSTSVSWRSLLMHIGAMTFPDLSLFAYYRWQHMSHHNKLGESDIDEVLLAELVDADVLAVSRYYSHNEGSASDTVGAKLIGYKLFLMFNPLLEWVENTLVFLRHIVLIPHTFLCPQQYRHRNLAKLKKARLSILIHSLFIAFVFYSLYCIAGVNSICYLLFSFLFIKGFLFHPYVLFWLTEHKTTRHRTFTQPTTSMYHWLSNIVFWGMNHHVEHHDFPGIPSLRLIGLRKQYAEHYQPLFAFGSILDAYRAFLAAPKLWPYAGKE